MSTQELVSLAFNNDAIGFQKLATAMLDDMASQKVADAVPTIAAGIFGN